MKLRNKKKFYAWMLMGCISVFGLMFESCDSVRASSTYYTNAAFEYREIYLPESTGKNAQKLHLNNLDDDWGIWGHNLAKVLPKKPSQSVFSKKNGVTSEDQFCFTSNRLFEYIEEYIDDKYDEDESVRFSIIPNDNDIVCLCEKCVAIGNNRKDASPAVFYMIQRLSERFPNHTFFTSHYRTAKGYPEKPLPSNVGVLISAIDFPLLSKSSEKEETFRKRLAKWTALSNHVYVWDYINNFDDYFTPFPVFDVMQHRLQLYRDSGVEGVFFNGSGTDYSSLSGMKALVLAELTVNPDIDWRSRLKDMVMKNYPVAGNDISEFIFKLEDYAKAKGEPLPLYDGVEKALTTYLPENEFIAFHDKIIELLPQTSGEEKEKLEKLCGALSLTRLEIARITGNLQGTPRFVEYLDRIGSEDFDTYNEAAWSIRNYIRDFRAIQENAKNPEVNLLKGASIVSLTELDPEYSDLSILTDGLLGIPSNYHCGNLINSPEKSFILKIPYIQGMKKLKVGLVYNPAYRISLPEEVRLTKGGQLIGTKNPTVADGKGGHLFLYFDIPDVKGESLVLTLVKKPESHSMALDEIEGF